MTYQEYLRSGDWQEKRQKKLARTSRCAICAATERLDVHHLNYRDLFDVTLSDLRVLCRRCHFLAHDLHRAGLLRFTSDDHNSRFTLTKTAVKKALRQSGVNLFDRPMSGREETRITRGWLLRHRTPDGGFTRAQLAAIGVSWPPHKGWMSALVGRRITDAQRDLFQSRVGV